LRTRTLFNFLFATTPRYSPPRQAHIWAALNMAAYAALLAAWHYKWVEVATRKKPRPAEVDSPISELYAIAVLPGGTGDGMPEQNADGFPGTPRHPTYPSGHSAVGGAAIEVLSGKGHFAEFKDDFDNLDNSGQAQWAGIHSDRPRVWRSFRPRDGRAGAGAAAAVLVLLFWGCAQAF